MLMFVNFSLRKLVVMVVLHGPSASCWIKLRRSTGTVVPRVFMRRSLAKWVAAIVAAIIMISIRLASSTAVAAEPDDTAALAVTVLEVKRMCLFDTLQVTGFLVPRRDILVRPSKEGLQIKDILAQPGDTVTSGQVLAHLKSPDGSKDSAADIAVNAPTAGVIYSISTVVGATASATGEPLFRIAQDGELELSAELPVDKMFRLTTAQSARVEVVGVGEMAGKVRVVSTATNRATQLGDVRLYLGADRRLRVGAFGRGIISIGRPCGPVVPLSVVLYGGGGAIVQVVREGRIESRQVTISLIKDGNAEIQEGLAVGETVVARAGALVRDGDRVRSVVSSDLAK
jgi:HlyD family secretion protein